MRLFSALFSTLFFLAILQVSMAAEVTPSSGVLAYVIDTDCPSSWNDLSSDGTYRGRLIKGWNSNSNLGSHSGSAISNNNFPVHKHPSWSRRLHFNDQQRTSCLNLWSESPKMVDDGAQFYLNEHNSAMDDRHPRIQRVTLRLCHFTSGSSFYLPPGIVVYIHHTKTTCPSGFLDFGDAHGRFLVFASAGKNMGGSDKISPAAPVTTNVGAVGYHTHNMPASSVQLRRRDAAHIYGCCGPTGAQWKEWRTMEAGTASSQHLNIPYVQLRACIADSSANNGRLPSPRLIFFYPDHSCPSLFREATGRTDGPWNFPFSNIAGRMIFNMYDANLVAGQTNTDGEQLYCATGGCGSTGHAGHWHYYGGYNNMPSQDSECSWDWGLTSWTDYRNYGFFFDTAQSNQALFPYRVMRACSAQEDTKNPTSHPTKSPTTSKPTLSPTTSFPTRNPTHSPTSSMPTKSPTRTPSSGPTTSLPTTSPTTSKPSTSPTTSAPTTSPTFSPSWAPTPSPVWKDVCTSEDEKIFVDYDNYVIQAGLCTSTCRREIFSKDMDDASKCIENCDTLSLYTPLCRACMRFWIFTQDDKCRGRCLGSKFSLDCANCTNAYARPDFRICSGFELADISYGGGDGGKNAPREQGIDAGLVSGIALGSMAALAGAFFAGRKIREKMLENETLTKEMELAIFKGGPEGLQQPPPPSTKPKFFGMLFRKSSPPKHSSGRNNSIVAGDDMRESMDNPVYLHASRQPTEDTVSVAGVRLRTRYSFHGTEADELDVRAGATLLAVEKNDNWYVCQDETTGKYGLIPASYVSPT